MNKTYKTVWNQATRTWAVASELAKSKTKSAGGKAASTVASATMLVASVTGIATMAAPLRTSAAEQAVFNDGTSNACTAINSDGTTSNGDRHGGLRGAGWNGYGECGGTGKRL